MDSLHTYLRSFSDVEWELIYTNSMLVVSKLEAVSASNKNIALQERLALLEFENFEIKFQSEEQQKGKHKKKHINLIILKLYC